MYRTKYVHEIKTVPQCARDSSSEHYFPGSVQSEDSDPAWWVTLPIFGKQIEFKINSGANTSILSEETYNAMRPRPKLTQMTTTLLGVGRPLENKGQFIAHTEVKGQLFHFCVVVVSAKANKLQSRSVASRRGFILKGDEFEETFGDFRCLNTEPVRIVLRGGAEPYALSIARSVPIILRPK